MGLLRKCLALGALTGSDELRKWAKNELEGYSDDASLPPYRSITAPLFINQRGGNEFLTGQQINHLQIPKDLRKYVPESLAFRQPLEEIVQMAASGEKSMKMGYAIFSVVAAEWTKMLGPWQAITALYYSVLPSSIAGIVSMIRTTLVEIVIDLAKDVPLDSLPSKAKVDAAVQVHIGSQDNNYEVNVSGSNSGVIGQGDGSRQTQMHSAPSDLVPIIAQLRGALADVSNPEQRADAQQTIDDFDEAVSEGDPKPEKIKRRWGIIERVGTALGSAVLTEAVKQGAPIVAAHLQLLM